MKGSSLVLSQIQLPPVACDNPAAIFKNVNLHLITRPSELILKSRIKEMHPLIAGRDKRIGGVNCQRLHIDRHRQLKYQVVPASLEHPLEPVPIAVVLT
jgi:hypothetical protein